MVFDSAFSQLIYFGEKTRYIYLFFFFPCRFAQPFISCLACWPFLYYFAHLKHPLQGPGIHSFHKQHFTHTAGITEAPAADWARELLPPAGRRQEMDGGLHGLQGCKGKPSEKPPLLQLLWSAGQGTPEPKARLGRRRGGLLPAGGSCLCRDSLHRRAAKAWNQQQ